MNDNRYEQPGREIRGLVLSAASARDDSAYTHRIVMLARVLAEHGIKSDFLYMEDNPPLGFITGAPFSMLAWGRTLRRHDFIYAGGEEACYSLFFAKPLLKGPVLYDLHGDPDAQSALDALIRTNGRRDKAGLRVRLVSAMAMKAADHLITVARPHTEFLVGQGSARSGIDVIRNGVDLELFKPVPTRERPEYDFCYAGAFQGWQGMDNLVKALELDPDSKSRLLIVGFTPHDDSLRRDLAGRFGQRVELVDRTDRPGLVRLLASASVLIIPRISHPAIKHAFPTKFAEYAALGRPILVCDVDETADFVRKYECGFVAEPNPESLARTMRAAAATGWDELAAMGARARRMAEENFSWPEIGRAYAEMVRRAVDGWRRTPGPAWGATRQRRAQG